MPLGHAVLALLADGPSYGYSLRGNFEHAVGPQWGGLNIGHLYQVLDRLVRDGFVVSSPSPQLNTADRVVYTRTAAGRDELRRWLAQPAERSAGFRDELFLKLLAAAPNGPTAVEEVIARQRRHEYERLRSIAALKATHTKDPLVALLIEAAHLHTQADLALLDTAEKRAAEIAQDATDRRSAPATNLEHVSSA